MDFSFTAIGVLHSPFKHKFGLPRQGNLVTSLASRIEIQSPYNRAEAFNGIDGFSHLWLVSVLHDALSSDWQTSVRPPRLGGNRRVGVFASRSPHRPNPIGISVVGLTGMVQEKGKLFIDINGCDLMHGTPILDIKPYIPYADALPTALGGYTSRVDKLRLNVQFSAQAQAQCEQLRLQGETIDGELIRQLLREDPRPAYHEDMPDKRYAMQYQNLDVHFRVVADTAIIEAILLLNNNP